MKRSIPLSEFHGASDARRDELLSELVRDARTPPNGEAKEIDAEIRVFEQRYEMTSAQMVERLTGGQQRETFDICNWLMLLEVRDRLGEPTRSH